MRTARRWWLLSSVLLVAAVLFWWSDASAWQRPDQGGCQSTPIARKFSGIVYSGTKPSTAIRQSGVLVQLYGSNVNTVQGTLLRGFASNNEGYFELPWTACGAAADYAYYNIVVNASGYQVTGVQAGAGGTVRGISIEYANPPAGTLAGNAFWVAPLVTPSATATASSTATATPTGTLTATPTGTLTATPTATETGTPVADETSTPTATATAFAEGALCALAYNDLDRDGQYDDGEPPLDLVTIRLRDDQGQQVGVKVTGQTPEDGPGKACFSGLPAGRSYSVEGTNRPGYRWTTANTVALVVLPSTLLSVEFGAAQDHLYIPVLVR